MTCFLYLPCDLIKFSNITGRGYQLTTTTSPRVVAEMLLLLLFSVSFALVFSAAPVVDTKYGKIQGVESSTNFIFYGIPYAQPPLKDLRWAPPKDPASWSSVYPATNIKPGCPQYRCDTVNPPLVCPKTISEDCLYLNIWTPLGANASSSLAVMLYIHGGNFVHMSAGSPLYDGSILSQKGNVIIVNMDYRMGALGFLVTGTKEFDAVGNYGVLDQRQALKWVYENIKAFGGDPNRITLFGQSAGAQSAMIHLASADSSPYFHNAIIESSPFAIPYKTYSEALLLGAYFAKHLNCTARDVGCLRNRSSVDIAYAQYLSRDEISSLRLLEAFEPWGPWVDGVVVTGEPVDTIDKGHFQRKPVLLGTVSQETRIYIYSAWDRPVDTPLYTALVTATHPNHAVDILYEYPPDDPQDERDNLVTLSTDLIFGCATRHVTHKIVQYGIADVWLYIYDHAFSFPGWGNITYCQGYVCHGSEVPFVFQSAGLAGFNYTSDEIVLSDLLISYWTNFAKTGDPTKSSTTLRYPQDAPDWPRFHTENDWPYMHLKTPTSFIDRNYNGPYCDFWDRIGYND